MSVESATYISQLVSANPAGADPVSDGATHLRLVKSVLQSTFPNLGAAAVTSTAAQLNGSLCPIGLIALWTGAVATIPAGWAICNGTTYTRTDGGGLVSSPDLRDRFVVGAGNAYAVGATGGAATVTPTGSVGGYALTVADMPSHSHSVNDPGHFHAITDPGHQHSYNAPTPSTAQAGAINAVMSTTTGAVLTSVSGTGVSIQGAYTGISIFNNGGGGGHTHPLYINAQENRPPYYALAFIMKI